MSSNQQIQQSDEGKGRGKSVLVVIIEGEPLSVLKRNKKGVLAQEGKAKMVEFYRDFSSEDVNSLLAKTFSNLGKVQFVFLLPYKSNWLSIAKEHSQYPATTITLETSNSYVIRQ